ncbi:caspase b [Carassius gibelio]|uniref:caspase b n=1 Tax=Carassius gibelio TaxID=101364 RepID=UPI002279A691|nr:caspase b [Carassius gibelio]
MATTEIAILDALKELLEAEFKEFKWHLSNSGTKEDSIPRGKLENISRHDVVTLMVQQYRSSDAGKIAVRVLKKINQNELAEELKKKLPEVLEDVSAEGGASSSAAAAKVSTAGVNVTITSSNGGSVKAPVIHGGVFNGPINFS